MKVLVLEQKLEDMCEKKFYSSSGPIASRDDCFYKCDGYDSSCPRYRAIHITQRPYRRGILSLNILRAR